ncbi:MAG TPA: hypothetical protein DIU07_15785 [Rhodobacteraceae bacterium]|nr:hypothetical protein [Paracoccaceae bacterium]
MCYAWIEGEEFMNRRAFLATAFSIAASLAVGPAWADALVINSPGDGFVDLRTGPGSGFDTIYAMPHGSEVHTLEWSGPWVRVRHESGHTGWCSAQYLARTGPAALTVHSVGDS